MNKIKQFGQVEGSHIPQQAHIPHKLESSLSQHLSASKEILCRTTAQIKVTAFLVQVTESKIKYQKNGTSDKNVICESQRGWMDVRGEGT